MREELYFCDNDCGAEFTSNEAYFVEKLPCNVKTANKGESAVLCKYCYDNLIVSL
jgi:hypothetical protein